MIRSGRGRVAATFEAFAFIWLAVLSSVVSAQGVGEVTHLSGVLSVRRDDGASRVLSVRSDVREGDLLTTQLDTFARVKFRDGGEVVLRPGSQLKVDRYAFAEAEPASDNIVLSLLKGGLRAVTGLIGKRSKERVAYKTPTATIGVRGTHFGILFCNDDCANMPTVSGNIPANGLHVDVASGSISIANSGGQTLLNAGQFGFVASNLTAPVIVPPENGVQITVPPNISNNAAGGRSITGDGAVRCLP